MRSEKDVKVAVRKLLNAAGVWYYMPVQTGLGVHGIPDFVCCHNGRFLGVETKFGSNKQSEWQKKQGVAIEASGGTYLVINERNLSVLEQVLTGMGVCP